MRHLLLSIFALLLACPPAQAGLADSIQKFLDAKKSPTGFWGTTSQAYDVGNDAQSSYAILSGISFGTSGSGLTGDMAGDGDEVDDPVDPADGNNDGNTDIVDIGTAAGVYAWGVGDWEGCGTGCGTSTGTRDVFCVDMANRKVADTYCVEAAKPESTGICYGTCDNYLLPCNYWNKAGSTNPPATTFSCSGGHMLSTDYDGNGGPGISGLRWSGFGDSYSYTATVECRGCSTGKLRGDITYTKPGATYTTAKYLFSPGVYNVTLTPGWTNFGVTCYCYYTGTSQSVWAEVRFTRND